MRREGGGGGRKRAGKKQNSANNNKTWEKKYAVKAKPGRQASRSSSAQVKPNQAHIAQATDAAVAAA